MQDGHREVNRFSADREILHELWNMKVLRLRLLLHCFGGVQVLWDMMLCKWAGIV